MVKLIWTDQAIHDLGDIGDYIAENSEKYAKLTERQGLEVIVMKLLWSYFSRHRTT